MPNVDVPEAATELRFVSFKIYKGIMNQLGADAPTVTELENQLGEITWSRNGIGDYRGKAGSTIFLLNKTYISGFTDWTGDASVYHLILNGVAVVGYYTMYFNYAEAPNNEIIIEVLNAAFERTDLSSLLAGSKLNLPVIEVYP